MTKGEWVVNVFVAIMERIPLAEVDEEVGDTLTAYVESMGEEDVEEVYTRAVEGMFMMGCCRGDDVRTAGDSH